MGENRRAEQHIVGSNPSQTNNQGLIKKQLVRYHADCDLRNQMIASLGGEVKALTLSP